MRGPPPPRPNGKTRGTVREEKYVSQDTFCCKMAATKLLETIKIPPRFVMD